MGITTYILKNTNEELFCLQPFLKLHVFSILGEREQTLLEIVGVKNI